MKERILAFFKTYLLYIAFFLLAKVVFMLRYASLYAGTSWYDRLNVLRHGLKLDLAVAAYLTVIPALFYLVSVWSISAMWRRLLKVYFLIVSILLSIIFVADLVLYGYWGFRFDATALFYFFSSPADTMSSVSPWFVVAGVLVIVLIAALLQWLFVGVLIGRRAYERLRLPYARVWPSIVMLLLTAALFIPIRGGFTVSTMNTGKVYFSNDMALNHAAVNPVFNLMESLSKQKDFASQYRFMSDAEADRLFATLADAPLASDSLRTDSAYSLFRIERPDICLLILEGFNSRIMSSLGGMDDVAVCMDSLSQEGILFTRFYANSFRTDRGLVAVLSGYPAQPTTSIMKYPRKTQHLPSIAGSLRSAGYDTRYYYGGDADFTNMRSYLMSSGFRYLLSDVDFPVSERLSKWGVHDHLVFGRVLDDLRAEAERDAGGEGSDADRQPVYRVVQTSSSHEPFEVPYRRLNDDILNAFAYTDSCVGDFIRQYRQLPQWERTVIILVPDHLGCFQLSNYELERYEIPLLMIGGAVREHRRIDLIGSQHDIAATLLGQLGLPHDEFTFSKDLMNPDGPHFAFFTVPDAFGMVSDDNRLIFDNASATIVVDEGPQPGKNCSLGQAYLQKLYDDLGAR